MLAAGGDGCNHVSIVARNHNAERDLPIVGPVGGVKRPTAVVEANFALDIPAQFCFEGSCFRVEGGVLAHFSTECKIKDSTQQLALQHPASRTSKGEFIEEPRDSPG